MPSIAGTRADRRSHRMATTPDNWKAKLKELGFEFGPVWRHGYLDFDTGTTLVVSAGFGGWTYAKTRKRKDVFPVMYYDDQDRERYPDGHDLSRTKNRPRDTDTGCE